MSLCLSMLIPMHLYAGAGCENPLNKVNFKITVKFDTGEIGNFLHDFFFN